MAGAVFGEVAVYFSWQGAAFGDVAVSLFVAVQYLVMLECHFLWQAQHLVKFGMVAGVRNVVFFNTKCSWRGRLRADGFMVGSWSDRPRIVNDVSAVLKQFL